MDLLELLKDRFSVREFEDKDIEKELLEKVLTAGQVSPTACNLQPQRILVIKDVQNIKKMEECTKFTFGAPVILLICADMQDGWKRKYDEKNHAEIDVSIVTTQMMLEAHHLGLGTTWVCSFNPEKVKENFELPYHYEPINILPIGYPKKGVKPAPGHNIRKPLSDTVFYEKF